MKNLKLLFAATFLFASFTFLQASNTLKSIDVDKFTGIKVNGNYQVFLKQGSTQSVKIEGDETNTKSISTKVVNGIWSIQSASKNGKSQCNSSYNSYHSQTPMKVYITVATLDYISLSSKGKISTENTFNVNNIDLKLNGSGKMRLSLTAKSIESNLCGSGKLILKGSSKHLESRISGSGDIDAEDMRVENVNISVSGSGDAQVHATSYLKAKVSGSGDIYYKGSPSLHKSVSGSGSVSRI
jgi:hypothetical protein